MATTTTTTVRTIFSELQSHKLPSRLTDSTPPDKVKILLQPRVCTLRSYGSDDAPVVLQRRRDDVGLPRSFYPFLSEYIDNSRKTQDFEVISGRLAMVVFAVTITTEIITGNSLFTKMDLQGMAKATGVCFGAVVCAASFAWFSSARTRVGRIFTVNCNAFINTLIDNLVDGMFYENELSDWSDDI
ncbi:hypothetical protein GIB67_022638 [Kingdonia uniflora]|uniref:Stress enhanced protein 2 n=1 Tax=Kingdonia uniflora TaxID=39325 RepID=A0A7J7P882_9MAGN|nr:hypothetical protein GIB67_022638 [Kingdonia uniflora]